MDILFLSRLRYAKTVSWTLLLCCGVVAIAAILARATLDLTAALTSADCSLAPYILDSTITEATLLKEDPYRCDFLASSENGQELVEVQKVGDEWEITWREDLHE